MTDVCGDRRVGRPRSVEADEAILRAAFELFCECGFEGLSMEAVAQRAGVGKATIYRRYPSKVDLVMACARRVSSHDEPVAETGSALGDLAAAVARLAHVLTETDAGRAVPQMLAEVGRNPELAAAHRAFIAERRDQGKEVVLHSIDRGELRPDTDPALVVDLLIGAVFYRHVVAGEPVDAAFQRALVDSVIRAFAP